MRADGNDFAAAPEFIGKVVREHIRWWGGRPEEIHECDWTPHGRSWFVRGPFGGVLFAQVIGRNGRAADGRQ